MDRISGEDPMHPMDVDEPQSQSYVEGPIQPEVGALPTASGDGEANHRDAALARIDAPAEEGGESGDGTAYYEHAQSSPECLEDHAAGAFRPSSER